MTIASIDHLVLTVSDIGQTLWFYQDVLGMEKVMFGNGRVALSFGHQKINLHQSGAEFKPNAACAVPGSADICFLSDRPLEVWSEEIRSSGIDILEGPVERTGAQGAIRSIYLRDPDGNLIEISKPL